MASSSSSDGEEERKSKKRKHKHKHEKDKHKHEKDKHEKDKHKHHKREKKSHHRDKDDAAPPLMANLCVEPISEADYFLKAAEFQKWLHEERRTFLDEISSDDARRSFKKFADAWNAGKLPEKYYSGEAAGVGGAAQPAASRTRHQWGFVSKLSDADQLQLDRAADQTKAQTNLTSKAPGGGGGGGGASGGGSSSARSGPIGPARPSASTSGSAAGGSMQPASSASGVVPGSRLAELQAKESERTANWRKQLGL